MVIASIKDIIQINESEGASISDIIQISRSEGVWGTLSWFNNGNQIQINRYEGALIWDNQIMEVKGPQPGTEFRLMEVKGSQSGTIQINGSEGP